MSPAQQTTSERVCLSGTWRCEQPLDLCCKGPPLMQVQQLASRHRKDKHTSDGMDQLCSLLHLPWPLRVGLGLIKTMEASTCPLDHSQSDRLSCRYFGSLSAHLALHPLSPSCFLG